MPKKLLLAEDSLTIRKVFELALSRSDIAVTAVDNGEDAVRLAGEILPDLVVADLTLPGKNGFAVAAELRAMERTGKIPVLILSGAIVPLDEERFQASGAKGVLFKPFESRELLENIDRLLRMEASPPESPKHQEAPAVDEPWDFSDVLSEVETEAGKSTSPGPAPREGLLPGAILPGGVKTLAAFNEYDVSIDEIEEPALEFSAEPPPPPSASGVEHIENGLPADSPSPVTDLTPALEEVEEVEEVEEIEEIEHLEEVEVPAPPDAGSRPGDAELREFFAGRAAEIFRTVASEAVEKVMWEMTDRLSAEFSARLRESVEAVAWEVIPSTAEALIREEIARIRGQAGKPSP